MLSSLMRMRRDRMTLADDRAHDIDEAEFQRASTEFLGRLEALRAVETAKAMLPVGHPERPVLARRVEGMVIELLTLGRYQTRLAEAQAVEPAAPRPAHLVLAEWRAAIRRLEGSSIVTSGHADEVARLHAEYQRTVEERIRRSSDG
jgi:hypothetical protein